MIYSYDNHTTDEWTEFMTKLHAGERLVIDESMFDYFLDVLPPVCMNDYVTDLPGCEGLKVKISFGFAEGAMPIVYFWRRRGAEQGEIQHFCQQSKRMNPYA